MNKEIERKITEKKKRDWEKWREKKERTTIEHRTGMRAQTTTKNTDRMKIVELTVGRSWVAQRKKTITTNALVWPYMYFFYNTKTNISFSISHCASGINRNTENSKMMMKKRKQEMSNRRMKKTGEKWWNEEKKENESETAIGSASKRAYKQHYCCW